MISKELSSMDYRRERVVVCNGLEIDLDHATKENFVHILWMCGQKVNYHLKDICCQMLKRVCSSYRLMEYKCSNLIPSGVLALFQHSQYFDLLAKCNNGPLLLHQKSRRLLGICLLHPFMYKEVAVAECYYSRNKSSLWY